MKNLIIDLDGTICVAGDDGYQNAIPIEGIIDRLNEYRLLGFRIVIHTSRNMRTFNGAVGRINVETLPVILDWLRRYEVPFDEVIVGKPWCGYEGFYVDDRAVRPDEFRDLSPDEIARLIENKKCY